MQSSQLSNELVNKFLTEDNTEDLADLFVVINNRLGYMVDRSLNNYRRSIIGTVNSFDEIDMSMTLAKGGFKERLLLAKELIKNINQFVVWLTPFAERLAEKIKTPGGDPRFVEQVNSLLEIVANYRTFVSEIKDALQLLRRKSSTNEQFFQFLTEINELLTQISV